MRAAPCLHVLLLSAVKAQQDMAGVLSRLNEMQSDVLQLRSQVGQLQTRIKTLEADQAAAAALVASLREERRQFRGLLEESTSDQNDAGQLNASANEEAPDPKDGGIASVSPLGEARAEGRRLSPTTVCRWTPAANCGAADATKCEYCTQIHEYLEQKTTTHEFADIETCFGGNDYTNMAATYDGVSGNTTILYSSTPVASFATPLKVIHASACSTTAPTLSVEMDTTMSKLAVWRGSTSAPR